MKWTKTPPTEPGWYWCRTYHANGAERVTVCLVGARMCNDWPEEGPPVKSRKTCVKGLPGWGCWVEIEMLRNNESWAGPLPEPEEE